MGFLKRIRKAYVFSNSSAATRTFPSHIAGLPGGGEAPPGNPDVVGALFAQSNCLTYNKQLTRETCNTLCMCVVFMVFFLSALSCKSLRHWLLSKKGLQPGNHA